ncbi:transcription factor bHLH162-like [Corylus avellana]|uniref:transcription factor bHLH162-like n=1 Tax=Corylus avellana TaxID=13451 RepID=UPI00286C3944|nr:transcription factor bHLH162-like [Corylus avellana]
MLCVGVRERGGKSMKKISSSSEASKLDRKMVERNRRIQMKSLSFKLASLLPPHYIKSSKEMLSQLDQLDLAASYIKQLRERVEKLKGRKEQAMSSGSSSETINDKMKIGTKLPLVDLREFGSSIDVILITGLQKNFMLSEVLSILQEEGAEVVSASFSAVGDKVFHTIHAQVRISRLGVETSRARQRLQDLVF